LGKAHKDPLEQSNDNDYPIESGDAKEYAGEFPKGEEQFFVCFSFLDCPKGETAKQESEEKKTTGIEDQRTQGIHKKGQSSKYELGSFGSQENRKCIDTISFVAGDVFEIFDRQTHDICQEEVEEEWEREGLETAFG
jgi:hypothetical protein